MTSENKVFPRKTKEFEYEIISSINEPVRQTPIFHFAVMLLFCKIELHNQPMEGCYGLSFSAVCTRADVF
ncbi:MAG TPA: hypothetical protein VGB26_03380, partial [Nitrospiria bacterium]